MKMLISLTLILISFAANAEEMIEGVRFVTDLPPRIGPPSIGLNLFKQHVYHSV